MRVLLAALVATTACGADMIHELRLNWRGVSDPVRPSTEVAAALVAVPLTYGVRDMRPDPTAVGRLDNEGGFIVRTRDNVAQYCSQRFGELLHRAGARLNELPIAIVETDLLEYQVTEGGTFHGVVRLRVQVRRDGPGWSKVYEGTSKRWGRTHNPVNFNEALSNAFAEAVQKLLRDADFAVALSAPAPAPAPEAPGG